MIISIQYLRGIAALLVVFHHFTVLYRRHGSHGDIALPQIGSAGVDIFFVISGFIMIYIMTKRDLTPWSFWKDRCIRIIPVYWFYSAVMISIAIMLPSVLKTSVFDYEHSIKSLLFIPAYHPKVDTSIWPILIQGWSLNYEMFFYLVFGLTLLFSPKTRLPLLTLVFALLVITGLFHSSSNPLYITYTNLLMLEFIAGSLLGQLYSSGRMPSAKVGYGMLLVGFIGLLLSPTFPDWASNRAIRWGIPSSLIVFGALSIETHKKIPQIKPLRLLGDSSYSLYLVHTFILGVMGALWSKIGLSSPLIDVVFFLASTICCSVAGYLSFLIIEKPATRYLKRKLLPLTKRSPA